MNTAFNKYFQPSYLFLLFFVGLIIYFPGISGNFFILDDLFTIPELPTLKSWEDLWTYLNGNQTGLLKRPISITILGFIKTIASDNASFFKSINWLIHSINAILVYALIKQTSNINKTSCKAGLLLITTSIWYLHPLLVSTVLYPVQIMTLLASFFMLLTVNIYLYIRNHYDKFSIAQTVLIISLMLLATLSKEIGVLLPLHFLLLETFILKNQHDRAWFQDHKWLLIYIPLAIGFIAFIVIFPTLMSGYSMRDFSPLERLGLESLVLVHYLKQILLPDLSSLSLFQDYWDINKLGFIRLSISLLILFTIASLAWVVRKKRTIFTYGIFFFFISHLLESTIIPLEISFEHRNYLASIGIILATTSLFNSLKVSPHISYFFLVLYSVVLISISILRVQEWQNESDFFYWAYAKNNGSIRASEGYAQILINSGKRQDGIKLFEQLKLKTNNGAFDIKIASHTCRFSPAESTNYLNIDAINKNKYDKYLSQVLFELFQRVLSKKCQINYAFLIKYHQALLAHPQLQKQPSDIAIIKMLLGRYYWLNKQQQLSIDSYTSAFSMGNESAGRELLSILQMENQVGKVEEIKKQ